MRINFYFRDPEYLTIIDHRTGKESAVPINDLSIPATLFQTISDKTHPGITVYDPAYQNTAVVKSSISFIDGDKGVLQYRGYAIEELAEKATFLEVAYLLIYGELPNKVHDRIDLNLHVVPIYGMEGKGYEAYFCSQ